MMTLTLMFRVDENEMGWLMQLPSRIGDNQLILSIYFPIVAALSWVAGVKFVGAVVACEWANIILKW